MGLVVLVAGAVGLGGRIDRARTLPGLSGRGGAEGYARDALGSIAPVSAEFTEREIGRQVLLGISEDEPDDAPRGEDPRPRPRSSPPPTIRGAPGTFPTLTPGGWVLEVSMSADRSTVQPGDEIRYRMAVLNRGDEDFRGRSFVLEWHTPTNTVGRNPIDQCVFAPPLLAPLCKSQRLMLSAGVGEARHETLNTRGLVAVRPGERFVHDWFVQVLPSAASGTRFLNHAHLTVRIAGEDNTVRSDDVVVTVE